MRSFVTSAVFGFSFGLSALSALAQSSVTVEHSNGLIESYRAYIGRDDLFNSSGVRLTKPWQIIRQDRANFYVYGIRDRDDEADTFFADAANRQALEVMLRNGSMSGEAARMIVQGGVWIDVEIYGRGSSGRWINVTVRD
ncbi:hypothetical protein [Neorhizobium alkalisoli]|uniref:Uncharacterized protein n=1 Tax=Neorhizobium alkalisoli TaxID=528178 RepID=A0A561QSE8_9HYPH|nr:hypothetical protein [Neorhizobium alkalisoli]TWF53315.1 hypothetical protein FHW37_104594 [Neorhizobium alkalisoli]